MWVVTNVNFEAALLVRDRHAEPCCNPSHYHSRDTATRFNGDDSFEYSSATVQLLERGMQAIECISEPRLRGARARRFNRRIAH